MADNFVPLYSHFPYLSCFYFISPIEKHYNQCNMYRFHKIPMYLFSLTLHVYSLIDNRAEIGHQCLIWEETNASVEETKFLSILVSKMDFFFHFQICFLSTSIRWNRSPKTYLFKDFLRNRDFWTCRWISILSCERNQTSVTHTDGSFWKRTSVISKQLAQWRNKN